MSNHCKNKNKSTEPSTRYVVQCWFMFVCFSQHEWGTRKGKDCRRLGADAA